MILFTSQHKAAMIDLFHQALKLCVYHGTTPENVKALEQYIEWMKVQPEDLNCQVSFQSFPEHKRTILVLDLAFTQTRPAKGLQ